MKKFVLTIDCTKIKGSKRTAIVRSLRNLADRIEYIDKHGALWWSGKMLDSEENEIGEAKIRDY